MSSTPNTLNPFLRGEQPVSVNNFSPTPGGNGSILAGTVSSSIAMGGYGNSFQFQNTGTLEAFVEVGDSTVVAVAGSGSTTAQDGSMAVQPGAIVVYDYPGLLTPIYAAGVTASGTTLLRVSRGRGS